MPIIDNGGGCCGHPISVTTTKVDVSTSAAHFPAVLAAHPAQPAVTTYSPPTGGGLLLASAAIIALLTS